LLLFTIGPRDVSIVQSLYKAGIKVSAARTSANGRLGEANDVGAVIAAVR
jgi:hypothetical protein